MIYIFGIIISRIVDEFNEAYKIRIKNCKRYAGFNHEIIERAPLKRPLPRTR